MNRTELEDRSSYELKLLLEKGGLDNTEIETIREILNKRGVTHFPEPGYKLNESQRKTYCKYCCQFETAKSICCLTGDAPDFKEDKCGSFVFDDKKWKHEWINPVAPFFSGVFFNIISNISHAFWIREICFNTSILLFILCAWKVIKLISRNKKKLPYHK